MKKELTYEQALNRAAALCSQAERCPYDIFEKAIGWGLTNEDAARLVAALTKEKFLSEERFAHAFAHDKFTYAHWGRQKIQYALRMKRIDDRLIASVLDEIVDADSYLETLADQIRTKMRGMKRPLSRQDYAKVYRFAAQRGYESAAISQAIRMAGEEMEDDEF